MSEQKTFDIYLASASPRRRELLEQIGVTYQLLDVAVPETPHPAEPAEVFVQRLALAKARAGIKCLDQHDIHPVMGADTSVVVDGEIMGKPRNEDDAKNMLLRLAGRSHQVMSAVALISENKKAVKLNISNVTFRELSMQEIQAYWNSGECQDKAGAYAIQGQAAIFIKELQGSYSGVMGLPLFEAALILQEFGINSLK